MIYTYIYNIAFDYFQQLTIRAPLAYGFPFIGPDAMKFTVLIHTPMLVITMY